MQGRRRFLSLTATGCLSLVAGCGGGSKVQEPKPVPILLPAYFYDASIWQQALKPRAPSHKIIANVNSGPGTEPIEHFQTLFNQARALGHQLMGYVATGYGTVPPETVVSQSLAWKQLYGIEHIFLDEVSNLGALTHYYGAVVQAIRASSPQASVVLNPGLVPDESYFLIDPKVEIVVFESTWADFQKISFPGWMSAWWPRSHLMVYDAPIDALAPVYAFASQRHASGFFMTDSREAIYHEQLPSYWEQELAL